MATSDELFTPHLADKLLIVKFYHDAKENKFKSFHEGRPVFDDVEMLEINFPADRAKSLQVPAHAEWKRFGTTRVTYAERFKEHYARFKLNEGPVVEGTPLSEAPFLSMAQKASLKALQVYTIEQLSSLTGQALKNIGAGGLALQQQAEAYMAKASGTADVVKMQIEIEDLKRQLAERPAPAVDGYDEMDTEALKAHIEAKTGSRPRGNPNAATLRVMARDIDKEVAA